MAKAIVTKETLAEEQLALIKNLPDDATTKEVVSVVNALLTLLRSAKIIK